MTKLDHPTDHAYQLQMELLFAKNQLIPRIRKEFVDAGFGAYMIQKEIPQPFGFSLLVQMVLHRQATLPTLVGILRVYFEDESNPSQACADMLKLAAEANLINWNEAIKKFVMIWDVNQAVHNELAAFQYPIPMLVPPKEVKNNTDTGYLTIKGSIILQDNHTEDDVCLDHINYVNQIQLRLNDDVARMVKNKWRNLDHPKSGETTEEYVARTKAFEKYDYSSREVMQGVAVAGGSFYMTHKYDKRGRTYAQGYHVNPQGNAWNKAVVEFAHQEVANA